MAICDNLPVTLLRCNPFENIVDREEGRRWWWVRWNALVWEQSNWIWVDGEWCKGSATVVRCWLRRGVLALSRSDCDSEVIYENHLMNQKWSQWGSFYEPTFLTPRNRDVFSRYACNYWMFWRVCASIGLDLGYKNKDWGPELSRSEYFDTPSSSSFGQAVIIHACPASVTNISRPAEGSTLMSIRLVPRAAVTPNLRRLLRDAQAFTKKLLPLIRFCYILLLSLPSI